MVAIAPDPATDETNTGLQDRLRQMEATVARTRREVSDAPTLDDFDRSRVASIIMIVYATVIAVGLLLFIIRACRADAKDEWSDLLKEAADLIKTAVLPIVTLVLGYYFGKSGRAGG